MKGEITSQEVNRKMLLFLIHRVQRSVSRGGEGRGFAGHLQQQRKVTTKGRLQCDTIKKKKKKGCLLQHHIQKSDSSSKLLPPYGISHYTLRSCLTVTPAQNYYSFFLFSRFFPFFLCFFFLCFVGVSVGPLVG